MRWSSRLFLALGAAALCAGAIAHEDEDEWKAPKRASKKKNPIASTAQSVKLGRKVYVRECLSCHGEKGKGDGPSAKDLETKPGDLTDPKLWKQTDGALFWKVTEGRKPMPGFEQTLKKADRWHVVNYLRTLAPRPGSVPTFVAPASYRSALSCALKEYVTIRRALAGDDFDTAKARFADLDCCIGKLKNLDGQALEEKARAEWEGARKGLSAALAGMKEAKDLASARSAFRALSEALASATAKFGHAEPAPLRVVRCPMAFEGKGAVWLQRGAEIANPYFGSKMLRCGKIEQSLGAQTKGGNK